MTPQQFLISKGFNPDAIQHPNDRDSINGYINLFEIMEEYALTKQTGTNTLVSVSSCLHENTTEADDGVSRWCNDCTN
jgi:hypothetical protein